MRGFLENILNESENCVNPYIIAFLDIQCLTAKIKYVIMMLQKEICK